MTNCFLKNIFQIISFPYNKRTIILFPLLAASWFYLYSSETIWNVQTSLNGRWHSNTSIWPINSHKMSFIKLSSVSVWFLTPLLSMGHWNVAMVASKGQHEDILSWYFLKTKSLRWIKKSFQARLVSSRWLQFRKVGSIVIIYHF